MLDHIRARIEDSNTCDAEISRLLHTPQVTDVPRPGEARAWNFSHWTTWGAAWGMQEADRTTHNFVLMHKEFPGLRLGMATSTGDTKSRMNMASDFRLTVRGFYRVAREAVLIALAETPAPTSEDDLYARVVAAYNDGRAMRAAAHETVVTANGATSSPTPIWTKLYKQATREKISPRQLMARLLKLMALGGCESPDLTNAATRGVAEYLATDYLESLYTGVSKGIPQPIQLMRALQTALADYVETYDVLKDEEKAAKAAAREAARATTDPIEAPLATPPVPVCLEDDPEDESAAALTSQLQQVIESLGAYAAAATEKDRRLAYLSAGHATQNKKILDLQDQCKALTAARDAAFSKAAALEAEHTVAQQLIAETAAVKDWKPAFKALVDSVAGHLHSSDFLALAAGVSHARAELAKARASLEADTP